MKNIEIIGYKLNAMIITLFSISFIVVSCNEPLNVEPDGVLSEDNVSSAQNVEGLVIAAYASLGNDNWFVPHSYPWPFGSVRSDDSYKGGLGTADIGEFNRAELHNVLRTDEENINKIWERMYISISRANTALSALNKLSEEEFPKKVQRQAEMRFIRGHFHFLLKIMFKRVPFITEEIPVEELKNVSNRQFGNDELWDKIAEDFQFAVDNLPLQSEKIGRADQLAAKAYLAKTRLYQAYKLAEGTHEVININQDKLQEVVDLTGDIINSGEFGLFDDFAKNYLWEFENGKESIYAVQRSKDDGTPDGNLARATALNNPMAPQYGCCSFNRPSQNLANAFQTAENGLPEFENFNNAEINTNQEFQTETFDPRLGHTVTIPGEPFKYQSDLIYEPESWTRAIEVYGPFSDVKPVQQVSCPCFERLVGEGFPSSSKNEDILRYDDVLLWRAEALIELGRHQEALPLINQIRERAMNSTSLLVDGEGNPIANFNMDVYKPGENINWTQENARKALRWERRLEFAMEGVRFFDLVRWGIADEVMNEYLDSEAQRRPFLQIGEFIKNRNEFLPIPEQQIDFSENLYIQNLGY